MPVDADGRDLGRVLVTGGSSGLGAAVALAVAGAGGTPIVLDRNPPPFDTEFVAVDLADTGPTSDAVRSVAAAGLDAVVTAAGIDVPGAPFQHIGILSLEFHVDKLSRPLL